MHELVLVLATRVQRCWGLHLRLRHPTDRKHRHRLRQPESFLPVAPPLVKVKEVKEYNAAAGAAADAPLPNPKLDPTLDISGDII